MVTKKLNKTERRYVAIQRILRSRNYGFSKVIAQFQKDIILTVGVKSDWNQAGRFYYNQLSAGRSQEGLSKQNLDALFDALNLRFNKLSDKLRKIAATLFLQGSSKVFDKNGSPIKLAIPKYEKEIDQLVENNLKYVKDITVEQRKKILNHISDGIKNGKSYKDIASNMLVDVDSLTRSRAELIAKNESHLAHSKAMMKTMQENGIDKYQWLSAGDSRVSPICQSLHRQVFKIGQTGKMSWRDINGKSYQISKSPKPIHDSHIGCRCVTIAVVE